MCCSELQAHTHLKQTQPWPSRGTDTHVQHARDRLCAYVCVAVSCSVLKCVAVRYSVLQYDTHVQHARDRLCAYMCVAVSCSVLKCVAARYSVLQYDTHVQHARDHLCACHICVLQRVTYVCCSACHICVLHMCVAACNVRGNACAPITCVCCSVLQFVAACCSILQCDATYAKSPVRMSHMCVAVRCIVL